MSIKSKKVTKLIIKIYTFTNFSRLSHLSYLLSGGYLLSCLLIWLILLKLNNSPICDTRKQNHVFWTNLQLCHLHLRLSKTHHQAPLAKPVPLESVSPYRSDHSGPFLFFKLCHTLCGWICPKVESKTPDNRIPFIHCLCLKDR